LTTLRVERSMTIVLTTHLMEQADRCDRLAVLSAGRLVALDSPANLKACIGGDVITIVPTGDAVALQSRITEQFGPWPANGEPRIVQDAVRFEKPAGSSVIPALTAALGEQIRSITVGQPTLEDVFLHLTGHTLYGGEGGLG